MKILVLADVPGWIVERCVDQVIRCAPEIQWTKSFYACISSDEFIKEAEGKNLIWFSNWHFEPQFDALNFLCKRLPVIAGVRSHRYPAYVCEWAPRFAGIHAVNQPLAQTFAKLNSNTRFIPDGIEPEILDRPFVVGWAGRDTDFRYKGVELIMQAVSSLQRDGLNVRLEIATSRSPMPSFYRSIDLYVCASEAEGFSTPVMEALAMGLPVLSTRVGVPYFSMLEHAQWSIASEIAKAYAARRLIVGLDETLAQFRWSVIAKRFIEFFEETFERWGKRG